MPTETLCEWKCIHTYARHGWIYRGQSNSEDELKTSLERCFDREDIPPEKRIKFEDELIREFKRAYHQYGKDIPQRGSVLEWLSIMQHHGAPTRLLDFTYSIYVAAYFALEVTDGDCALWAINGPWAARESAKTMEKAGKLNANKLLLPFDNETDEQIIKGLFFEGPYLRVACPLNPFRLNERLRIQKGVFLVPADVTVSFMDNFNALEGKDNPDNVVKLVIPKKVRRDALRQLFEMNISRTSLFPGLDGYAQSLGIYHPIFNPINW